MFTVSGERERSRTVSLDDSAAPVATGGSGALVAPGSVRAARDLRKWLTCYRLRTIYARWQVWPDWELEIAPMGGIPWFT